MNRNYILDENNNPIHCTDVYYWAKWIEGFDRKLKRTEIGTKVVSTVFLGFDHRSEPGGRPLLWETMIFNKDGGADNYQERYSTRDEALMGHARAVETLSPRRRNPDDEYDIAAVIPFDRDFKY